MSAAERQSGAAARHLPAGEGDGKKGRESALRHLPCGSRPQGAFPPRGESTGDPARRGRRGAGVPVRPRPTAALYEPLVTRCRWMLRSHEAQTGVSLATHCCESKTATGGAGRSRAAGCGAITPDVYTGRVSLRDPGPDSRSGSASASCLRSQPRRSMLSLATDSSSSWASSPSRMEQWSPLLQGDHD